MTWVLVMTILYNGRVQMLQVDGFTSQYACNSAGEAWASVQNKWVVATFSCARK